MKYGLPTADEIATMERTGMTRKAIAQRVGVPEEDIDYLLADRKPNDAFNPCPLPACLELSGDFIIVGDVHVPYTDYEFAQLVGRVADKTGIRRLIIAGDFFDMDNWSKYEHAVQPTTWVQERTAAKILIQDWLEVFTEIYTIEGNHDRRLAKFSHGALQSDDTWSMITTNEKLIHSKRGYCTVNSAGVYWRVTHPTSYGRNQLTVGSELSNKHQTNVISWHEHHEAHGWDTWKRYVVVNGGSLVDPNKLAYVSLDDNRCAGMALGFVVLRNGVATPLGLYPFTDWDMWLS